MKTTSPNVRREFWKYQSAAIAFQGASRLALILRSMSIADELFYDLNLAMHVEYSRPFKHQESELRLSSDLVPKSHYKYHEGLLYCRDKAYAHHDRKTTKLQNEDGEEFASLVLTIDKGDLRARQIFPYLHPDELCMVIELCDLLQKICTERLSSLATECIGTFSTLEDGIYTVSSRFEGQAPLLKRMK